MNRRETLKNLTLIAGGTLVLPSCEYFSEKKASIALNHLHVSAKQEVLLAELAGTLIPDGETRGARELNVHNFVWVMVDDCMDKTDQERFLTGLDEFNGYSRKTMGKVFQKLSPEKKGRLLQEIMVKPQEVAKDTGNMHFTFDTVRKYTIQGYLQSKYIMTEVMPYALIPGSYEPCMEIDNTKPVNLHA